MSKHLVTIEVDTDLDQYGNQWGANFDAEKHADVLVPAYAETFGGGPGAQWDRPPFTRVVGILSGEARAVIGALVSDISEWPEGLDDDDGDPRERVEASTPEVWEEIRNAFPLAPWIAPFLAVKAQREAS